jgi:hypothetical protein
VFEMPEEISGQKNSNVVCQGRVTRAGEDAKESAEKQETTENPEQVAVLAASIVDYKFVR